jgi:hypothetical protein
MHWFEKRLVMLIGMFYATAMARAIAALPNDEALGLVPTDDEIKTEIWIHDSTSQAA